MSLEDWTALGIVCGAISALLLLLGLVARGIRRMWRAALNAFRRLSVMADDYLGDKANGIPSISERMASVEAKIDEHLKWHGDPKGTPAHPRPVRPNSTGRRSA